MRISSYKASLVSTMTGQTVTTFDWAPYMVTRRLSDNLISGYTLPGEIPSGYVSANGYTRQISNSPVTGIRLERYESKDSVSSVSWNTQRKVSVRYSRRPIDLSKYLRQPRKPVFKPFNFTIPKPPELPKVFNLNRDKKLSRKAQAFVDKVNSRRRLAYEKKVKRRKDLIARRNKYMETYRMNYAKRLAKYEKRLAIYNKRLAIVKSWKPPVRFASTRHYPYPDNPYLKFNLELLDGPGVCSWYYDSVGTTSPHVLNMVQYVKSFSSIGDADIDAMADSIRRIAITTTSVMREELDVKLTRKFYDKLSAQKVHVGNIIAERAQTLNLLRESSLRLLQLIKLKRNLFKSIGRFVTNPKKIGDDYLAFQFGVRPLMDDIYNSYEILMDDSRSEIDGVHIAIRTNSRLDVSIDTGGVRMFGKLSRSYVCKLEVENPFSRTANSYGLLNPAEIAWEVLPWSFVVDWFLPVGAWIGSLSAFAGVNYTTGVSSEKFQGTIEILNPALTIIKDASQLTPCIGTYALKYHERALLEIPGHERLLRVKNPLSWTHGFEALALLVQKALK